MSFLGPAWLAAVVFQQLAGQAILERVAPCASGVTFDVHNE
jgi:hypothetical protein